MIRKTEGIVLRTLKYQENHLITTVFTENFGMQSFIIKGYHSARSRRKHSYFQPLSIVQLVFFYKETQSLQKISDSKLGYLLHTIQTDPVKLSLGLTMVEVFYDTVKEEATNESLYRFLKAVILALDESSRHLIHLFLFFLVQLPKYLGFFPLDQSNNSQYVTFDAESGILSAVNKPHAVGALLREFMNSDLQSCQQIFIDRGIKRDFITMLFKYYQFHIDGFKYPQTLKVFAEIFED